MVNLACILEPMPRGKPRCNLIARLNAAIDCLHTSLFCHI